MKPKKGFTLVELLVIIAIILIIGLRILRVVNALHPHKSTLLLENAELLLWVIFICAFGLFSLFNRSIAFDLIKNSFLNPFHWIIKAELNYEESLIGRRYVFIISIALVLLSAVGIVNFLGLLIKNSG